MRGFPLILGTHLYGNLMFMKYSGFSFLPDFSPIPNLTERGYGCYGLADNHNTIFPKLGRPIEGQLKKSYLYCAISSKSKLGRQEKQLHALTQN